MAKTEDKKRTRKKSPVQTLKDLAPLMTLSGIFVMTASVLNFIAQGDSQIISASQNFLIAGIMCMVLTLVYFVKEAIGDGFLKSVINICFMSIFYVFVFWVSLALLALLLSDIFSGAIKLLLTTLSVILGLSVPSLFYEYVYERKHIKPLNEFIKLVKSKQIRYFKRHLQLSSLFLFVLSILVLGGFYYIVTRNLADWNDYLESFFIGIIGGITIFSLNNLRETEE